MNFGKIFIDELKHECERPFFFLKDSSSSDDYDIQDVLDGDMEQMVISMMSIFALANIVLLSVRLGSPRS
jgi:hypothetical protein